MKLAKKIKNKKNIAIAIIVCFLVFVIYKSFFKKTEDGLVTAEVGIGNVVREISETGQIKKGEKINLGFKTSGIIEEIYIQTGEEVKKNDILAKLENSQLDIQLIEAWASLELYQAQLDKLLAGATSQEIQVKQTAVDNAQIALDTAKQTLEDTKAQGEEDLKSAYEDALNVLDDAYIKIFNSFNIVDLIQRTYFTSNDQESISVKENKDKIKIVLDSVESYLDTAKTTQENNDIDITLVEMKSTLSDTFDALKIIREKCETLNYRNTVSSADKTLLDTHRGYINTALTNIVNSQQTISSTKLDNSININTYQSKVNTAQGSLKAAQDDLAQLVAPARKEDVSLYQAQVKQVQAQVWLLQNQIEDTILKAPMSGQIIAIGKRVGELVQSALKDAVITILPADPFSIEVDIYEEDVAKMDVGNTVDISLVAFPEEKLKGKIISIDPAEKMIDGVVYYEVSISLEQSSSGIKPGMTADLVITTDVRENVLTVPEKALKKKNGKTVVQILEQNQITEREIEIGLKGTNDLIEIVSGLEQGEQVILP